MKYQLTISILVSNRIDTIRKCLDSIKPLLEELDAELIIVDTGSTDGSVEIAKEYTDKIIPFAWCGDFAAARNAGLQRAKGEWFMYMDDDEWFENVDEIIHFFKNENYLDYGRAFYVVRNYDDYEGIKYLDTYVCRMFRRVEGICFRYRIHEMVNMELDPLKVFQSYAHHYGYVGKQDEKSRRNIELLERELEANPSDMRMLGQIVNEYFVNKQYNKIIELKDRFAFIRRENVNDAIYCYVHAKIAESYYQMNYNEVAIQYANELLTKGLCNEVTEMYAYVLLLYIYLELIEQGNDYIEVAVKYYEKYMQCFKQNNGRIKEFSQIALFGMAKILEQDFMNSLTKQMENMLIRETKKKELQGVKQKFKTAIQLLIEQGQFEAALSAIQQALQVLGNDEDMLQLKVYTQSVRNNNQSK